MSTMLADLSTRLIANTSLTALGTDIFYGVLPDSATGDVVLLRETGGSAGERGFGDSGVRYENPSVQVLARGDADDYAGPRALLQAVWNDLATIEATSLSSTAWLFLTLMQSPTHLKKDEMRRHSWVFNLVVEKEPQA